MKKEISNVKRINQNFIIEPINNIEATSEEWTQLKSESRL